MKHVIAVAVAVVLAATALAQQPRELKPGWNLFSKEQDIQLGREAAAEIEKQVAVVNDAELNNYIRRIGERLAAAPEAGGFPYSFKVVADNSINAFALPGGPTYVHTGLIAAAENEAQLAGVMAHEISHVALRHGTNQASKANLIQLPAILAGAMVGSGSMLGSLAQLGIGLGANSVLLKFSRSAESDADLLGARIMSRAGYNPIEMARFFEKLEAEGGSRGLEFFSSHPNPGNRVKAVEEEIRMMAAREYTMGNTTEFTRVKRLAAATPVPKAPAQQQAAAATTSQPVPAISISGRYRQHRADFWQVSYPDNWQVVSGGQSGSITIAPPEGVVNTGSGGAIGLGAVVGVQTGGTGDLRRDTDALAQQLIRSNPGMKAVRSQSGRVNGQPALLVTLQSQSPWAGETEVDSLVTVRRPQGLFYMVLIAPRSAQRNVQGAFDTMIRSIRFTR